MRKRFKKSQPRRATFDKLSAASLKSQSDVVLRGQVRVRIAPSPTGSLHIGTARTALFNYLFAKKHGGKFILRIEDTDLERSDQKWEKDILEGLKWLGIKWDEFYQQSERIETYQKYIKQLLKEKKAFWCWHTKEELEEEKNEQMKKKESPRHNCIHKIQNTKHKTQEGIIRLDTLKKIVKFNDLIRGEIEFDTGLLGDISLAKDERTPLYNFAVVVDDYEMKISHVIRGEDHISNTPKQILIQEALGFPMPEYAHLPLILGPDRSKLSKRHAATSISEYRKEGYLAEALVNFMALLGWNLGDNREIFSIKELIRNFSLEKIQKSGAVFNLEKLDWMNGYYIRKMTLDKLTKLCASFLKIADCQPPTANYIKKIIALEQPRLKKLSEIRERTDYFFQEPKYEKELLRWKNMSNEEIKKSLEKSIEIISKIQNSKFKIQNLEKSFLEEAEKLSASAQGGPASGGKDKGELLWPLRVAFSGKKASPGPFEIAVILGKEEVLRRISNAIKILEK